MQVEVKHPQFIILFDPKDGSEFRCPTSANSDVYLRKGYHQDEKRAAADAKAYAEAQKKASTAKKAEAAAKKAESPTK